MADIPVSQDEHALRRRARRRLVGAIAIALTAVVVLPMLFDTEPKPLGPDVDVRIPAKNSPFEAEEPAPTPQPPPPDVEEPPQEAEPTSPMTLAPSGEENAREKRPVPEKVSPKTVKAPEVPPMAKTAAELAEVTAAAKPSEAVLEKGYYLQLGAFSNERNAKQLQSKVQAIGFKAGLSNANGQVRVRVGPIAEHETALNYLAQLKDKGFKPVLIAP